MRYNNKLENFVDGVDFTAQDPCVWIVYPPGSAGDFVASIVNFHYVETGCHFYGLMPNGQAKFVSTDSKLVNQRYRQNFEFKFDPQFIHDVNEELGRKHLNYSLLDQVIFSNHAYKNVSNILDNFPQAKIIRILPRNTLEEKIINWLSVQKNEHQIQPFVYPESVTLLNHSTVSDPRLLEIYFGDLFDRQGFEKIYSDIVRHLELNIKLIRFDYVEYWLSLQHDIIQPVLKTI